MQLRYLSHEVAKPLIFNVAIPWLAGPTGLPQNMKSLFETANPALMTGQDTAAENTNSIKRTKFFSNVQIKTNTVASRALISSLHFTHSATHSNKFTAEFEAYLCANNI
jgi:predicted nucleic acid-binding protein